MGELGSIAAALDIPEKLVGIADKLGIIESVKAKLVSQPDRAATKLVVVLEELLKIYISFESEVVSFLSISVSSEEEAKAARPALFALEAGALRARMSAARGRSGKITNIYQNYLNPWFQRVLGEGENEEMRQLFREMSHVDSFMVDVINDVTCWLEVESEQVLTFLLNKNFEGVERRLADARRQLLPSRRAIAGAMSQIQQLEAYFITAAQVA
jgi:hypothetical protein